ncbi:MAG: hypothetical protein WCA11_16075, partial [Terracidiphilus sp.]
MVISSCAMGRSSVDATNASLMRRARAEGRLRLRRLAVDRLALPFFAVLTPAVVLLPLCAVGVFSCAAEVLL